MNSDAWGISEGDFSVNDLYSLEKVVGDEQVAVQVGEINGRGELCGSRHGT